MDVYGKSISFVRRLSVFFLFIGIFSVFLGVFYYKYMPDNQAELNTRGFRILNQLTGNMIARNAILTQIFNNVNCPTCTPGEQRLLVKQIQTHTRFDSLTPGQLTQYRSLRGTPVILPIDNKGLCFMYPLDGRQRAIIRIPDFIEPVLAARDDLFDSYVLLQSPGSAGDSSHDMHILYLQKMISSSFALNADSAFGLRKNSDLSGISNVIIGGESYLLFIQPFTLAGSQKMVLGGLIRKDVYNRQVKTLPTRLMVGMIMMILIGLILLPFLKVFYLSPKENVHRRDVLSVVLALYLGSAVLVLAGVYFLADFSAQNAAEDNLKTISRHLENDISHDLDAAGRQLEDYIEKYRQLETIKPQTLAKVISYKDTNPQHKHRVDRIFTPVNYPLVSRIIWVDQEGNTMAKWNPFTFISPPASVKGYDYFSQLQQKNDDDSSMVFGAVKSNITGEFQLILARHLHEKMDTMRVGRNSDSARSFAIILAFYLHSGIHPILPKGYGFCLVDNRSMEVLMHSDSRRNLAENLGLETNNNVRVKNCIDFRLAQLVDGVNLYGAPNALYIQPVRGQELSVVVFYNEETHAENIFRMVHFGAETMLYISLAFFLCLLLSTGLPNRPSKLSFNLDPVEWIRPLERNRKAYDFNQRYFLALLILSLGYFLLLRLAQEDIRIAYYLSLLLPFYALWGFLASRRNEDKKRHWLTELVRPARFVVVTLALLNWLIFLVIGDGEMDHGWKVKLLILLFEALAVGTLAVLYHRIFAGTWAGSGMGEKEGKKEAFARGYVRSLFRSIIVMSIIPMMGFLWYGWSVEKIQFIRGDELSIAGKYMSRIKYLTQDLLPGLKPVVLDGLDGKMDGKAGYEKKIIDSSGRYLAKETIVSQAKDWRMATPASTMHDPDEPYITLLDNLFLITAGEYNSYSIRRRDADTSWAFETHQPDSIYLNSALHWDSRRGGTGSFTDSLLKDFRVGTSQGYALFSFAGGIGWMVCILLVLAIPLHLLGLRQLLALTVNRIFLLHFIKGDVPCHENVPAHYLLPDGEGLRIQHVSREVREEHILQAMLAHKPAYQRIWEALPRAERYFLFDFAKDGYTNYKDTEPLFSLLEKGLLVYEEDQWKLFAIPFREFILSKKGTPEIARLKEKYAVPGVWSTIRIPTLIIIAACAVLLVMTQENVSHQIMVALTSVGAIVPVVMELLKKLASK